MKSFTSALSKQLFKIFSAQKFFSQKFFWCKFVLLKLFWMQKNFRPKLFGNLFKTPKFVFGKKHFFHSKICLGPLIFLTPIFFYCPTFLPLWMGAISSQLRLCMLNWANLLGLLTTPLKKCHKDLGHLKFEIFHYICWAQEDLIYFSTFCNKKREKQAQLSCWSAKRLS